MRVLLIVDSYLPEPKATGPMFHSLARELMDRGHQVMILTVSDTISAKVVSGCEAGLSVVRVRTPRLKGISLARRAIRELLLSNIVWARARRAIAPFRADLIAFYSPTIFWGPLVRRLKRLWRARTVLILRDIFPQWALDAGRMRAGPHFLLFEHYAALQYRAADRIGVQSPRNLEYFRARAPEFLPKTGVLFNWTSGPRSAPAPLRADLGIPGDRVIFLYGGNLGDAQDPDLLLATARALSSSNAVILVVGEGSATARIQAAIREEDFRHLVFWPSVAQERFGEIAAACDVGMVLLNRRLTTHNFPGKLLTYVSAELPVLASVNRGNDLRDILESSGAGICTWADEPASFVAAALRLAQDGALRAELRAQVGRRLAPVFSVSAAADFVLSELH